MIFDTWRLNKKSRDLLQKVKWISVEEFFRTRSRRASILEIQEMPFSGFQEDTSFPLSWLGNVTLALPGEEWPYWESEPMAPLCQINVSDAPFCPHLLSDVAVITAFGVPKFQWKNVGASGDKWLIRAYTHTANLVPLQQPALSPTLFAPTLLRWQHDAVQDFPRPQHVVDILPAIEGCPGVREYLDRYNELFPTYRNTKIGGWPLALQETPTWGGMGSVPSEDPQYILQIDSRGDLELGYIGRSVMKDVWTLEWQDSRYYSSPADFESNEDDNC